MITNKRQHGPQLTRLFAHNFSWPIFVALLVKMWLWTSVSMAHNWRGLLLNPVFFCRKKSVRGRYLWHS